MQRLILKVKYINLHRTDLGHVMFIYITVCIIKAGKLQYEAKCLRLIIGVLMDVSVTLYHLQFLLCLLKEDITHCETS